MLAGVHQLPDTRSVVVIRSTVGFQALGLRRARFASVLVLSLTLIGAASIACSSRSTTKSGTDASGGGTTGGGGGDSSANVGRGGASGGASGGARAEARAEVRVGGASGGQGGASGGQGDASIDGSTRDAAVDAAIDTIVSDGCVTPRPVAVFDANRSGHQGSGMQLE